MERWSMSYCFNPQCQNPHNSDRAATCDRCGTPLLLKNRYRLLRLLGQGKHGRTFLAIDEDRPSQPACTVKQYVRGDRGDAYSSRATLSGLEAVSKHPRLPSLWAFFQHEDCQYLVCEYLEGGNLAAEVAEERIWSAADIRQLLESLLPLLQLLHDRHILHRDIKPENILRLEKGFALVDFGSAQSVCDRKDMPTMGARSGQISGAAEYIAPEQLRGMAIPSSDLYSLGVTCLHLLTHLSPFELFNAKTHKWVWRDMTRTAVDASLAHLLDRLVHPDPKQRYASATAALRDLHRVRVSQPQFALSAAAGVALAFGLAFLSNSPRTAYQVSAPIPEPPLPSLHDTPETDTPETVKPIPYHARKQEEGEREKHGAGMKLPYRTSASPLEDASPLQTFTLDEGNAVGSVAVSPDGTAIAVGTESGAVKLLDARSGTPLATLPGHQEAVWSVAISSDGRYLASASRDGTVTLWDFHQRQFLRSFRAHAEGVLAIALSPDSQQLASAGKDGTVNLWDITTGNLQQTLVGHTDEVQSVTYSPDGNTLATGSSDRTVKLWDPHSGLLQQTLTEHTEAVWSVAISSDGRTLASASWDGTIQLWELPSGTFLRILGHGNEKFQDIAFSPDSSTLASSNGSGTVQLWSLHAGGD
ncbi:MAG: protein kinase [Coleofasciculaceae cyanobacterium SM2_3_26]|nr:protein kinase [Coleofasciculaceae cyanobacterium SM2_3_26]